MRSFIFNGTDFGCLGRAKVVEERALSVVPKTAGVPGLAGEAILDAAIPPKVVKLKLFLDPMGRMDAAQLVEVRRRLYAALVATTGAEFQYEDNYVYHDALCTDAGAWASLFEDGSCELTFTLYDPIAYSNDIRLESGNEFDVRGTWKTYPVVEIVADGSSGITVTSTDGKSVVLTGGFVAGSVIVLDYKSETVTYDGVPSGSRIALASTFSAMQPGKQRFAFTGASTHSIKFHERWV